MRRRSKLRLVALALGASFGAAVAGGVYLAGREFARRDELHAPFPPVPDEVAVRVERGQLELTLETGPDESSWTAELRNRGALPVMFVAPGDGGTDGRRTPRLSWTVAAVDGTAVEEPVVGWCGVINPLRADEILVVEPGGSKRFALSPPWWGDMGGVARYYATLEFENDPDAEWNGIVAGPHHPDALAAMRRSTRFTVRSNRLLVGRR